MLLAAQGKLPRSGRQTTKKPSTFGLEPFGTLMFTTFSASTTTIFITGLLPWAILFPLRNEKESLIWFLLVNDGEGIAWRIY